MGHEVTRRLTTKDHHREVRIVLDAPDQRAKLIDGAGARRFSRAARLLADTLVP
jgi:dihydrodipicolinate synthase/N-acetylneuraminate lyase